MSIHKLTEDDLRLREIARANVDRHLGDCVDGEMSADAIYEEAFTLAVDALLDLGVPNTIAHPIAVEVAMGYAQP